MAGEQGAGLSASSHPSTCPCLPLTLLPPYSTSSSLLLAVSYSVMRRALVPWLSLCGPSCDQQ